MNHDKFNKLAAVSKALGLVSKTSGAICINKIKSFVKNIDSFKGDMEALVAWYDENPIAEAPVVIDKDGKVFLVHSLKVDKNTDGEAVWAGVKVIDFVGANHDRKIEDFAPYNETTKVLFGKKD